MAKVISICLLAVVIIVCAEFATSSPHRPQSSTKFVIDANREFVYLKFDHLGAGVKRWDSEPASRVWLRFVNNCNVPIRLRTYGEPNGSLPGEIGVMDEVVVDPPLLMQVVTDEDTPAPMVWNSLEPNDLSAQPTPDTKPPVSVRSATPPHDYWFEVGSSLTVQPGKDVLFSIPVNQFGTTWHVEIPFEFEVPEGKIPRDPYIGGQPEMHLTYSIYDLPDQVRSEIEGDPKR